MQQRGSRRVVDSESQRRADLARIHLGAKELGWDEDTYRDIMAAVCNGVRSSALLDFTGRKRFLAHLASCGAGKPATKAVKAPLTPVQRKMWALWQQLADAGLVNDRKMPALMAYVERQTKVARLEWLTAPQADMVVESMKRWLKRASVGA